jgi:hypothetical protein
VTVPEQPLITTIPNEEFRLPTEPAILEQNHVPSLESLNHVSLSGLGSVDVGGFGRLAQAAWLVDQVLKGFHIPNLDVKLKQLHRLDGDIQAFLSMLMQPCCRVKGVLCETIAIAIRSVNASGPTCSTTSKHHSDTEKDLIYSP